MPSLFDTFAASSFETALRGALRADPATRAELAALAPGRLRLELSTPPVTLTLVFAPEDVHVEADRESAVDATVIATPAGIVDLVSGDRERAVMSGSVRMLGDGAFAIAALTVLARLRPDVQGPLGRLFGEAPTAAAGAALRRGGALARQMAGSSSSAGRDWLTRPEGPLPSRPEVARFLDEVDDVRLGAERLEARVRALQAARAAATADPAADRAPDQARDPAPRETRPR